jgi:hypothetical protein
MGVEFLTPSTSDYLYLGKLLKISKAQSLIMKVWGIFHYPTTFFL